MGLPPASAEPDPRCFPLLFLCFCFHRNPTRLLMEWQATPGPLHFSEARGFMFISSFSRCTGLARSAQGVALGTPDCTLSAGLPGTDLGTQVPTQTASRRLDGSTECLHPTSPATPTPPPVTPLPPHLLLWLGSVLRMRWFLGRPCWLLHLILGLLQEVTSLSPHQPALTRSLCSWTPV